MCDMSLRFTKEELEEEMKNPNFCGCCETVCEGDDVINHCCKRCRGE